MQINQTNNMAAVSRLAVGSARSFLRYKHPELRLFRSLRVASRWLRPLFILHSMVMSCKNRLFKHYYFSFTVLV